MASVVKRGVGGGFDVKGRGGMGAGIPEADLKVEDLENLSHRLVGFLSKHSKICQIFVKYYNTYNRGAAEAAFLENRSGWKEASDERPRGNKRHV